MFLLVSKFKMIGMLLNVVHVRSKKANKKTYYKGFPYHSTLINYGYIKILSVGQVENWVPAYPSPVGYQPTEPAGWRSNCMLYQETIKKMFTWIQPRNVSPHVREWGNRNPWNFCLWNSESWALESRNSGIPLTIGIQYPSSTDKDWNPVTGIRDPWRGIRDPRLFLGFLTCGETLHENESNKV